MTDEQKRLFQANCPFTKGDALEAPFGYPGSKRQSLEHLLKYVPYKKGYVEVFGGSGALLLARMPSAFEVFNDRHSGVVNFYRCIAQHKDALVERLNLTVYSREEWEFCHETWEEQTDPIEKAARWYYNVHYSFSQLGRNFGRSLKANGNMAGKLHNKLPEFYKLQNRLRKVFMENMGWDAMLNDYDSPDHVFYLDPPYLDTPSGTYRHNMSPMDHQRMLDKIGTMSATVCVSGNSSPLYKMYDRMPYWKKKESWDINNKMKPMAEGEDKFRTRGKNSEVLWIKE